MRHDPLTNETPADAASSAISRAALTRRFERAARTFAQSDFVHQHCFSGLIERLEPMNLDPRRILDLGGGAGRDSRELRKRYRGSRVVTLDLSHAMLCAARSSRSRFARIREVQADAVALPFRDDAFEMVVANLVLPWIDDLPSVLSEVSRVVQQGGLFVFATLGPDSLRELRSAWQGEPHHVQAFPDMHIVGDALTRARLADPVLDVDPLTIRYRDAQSLFRDLTAVGGRNALSARRRTLTGKARFSRMRAALGPRDGSNCFDVHLELVFGHAWGSARGAAPGEFHVAPDAIGRRNF